MNSEKKSIQIVVNILCTQEFTEKWNSKLLVLGLIYHFNKEGLGFEEQMMGKGLGNIWGKLTEDKGYFS